MEYLNIIISILSIVGAIFVFFNLYGNLKEQNALSRQKEETMHENYTSLRVDLKEAQNDLKAYKAEQSQSAILVYAKMDQHYQSLRQDISDNNTKLSADISEIRNLLIQHMNQK